MMLTSPPAGFDFTCASIFTGGNPTGTMKVTCPDVNTAGLSSLTITVTMNVTQGNSLPGSATSSATVGLVCCSPAGTSAYAVKGDGSCLYCGPTSSSVDAVWIQGPLSNGQMQAGPITPAGCSGQLGAVGTIQSTCPQGLSGRVMTVIMTYPAGTTAPTVELIKWCLSRRSSSIIAGAACPTQYLKQTKVTETATGSSTVYQFSFQLTTADPNCRCGTVYWAVKQTGRFASSSSGSSACSQNGLVNRSPGSRLRRKGRGF